MKKVSEEDLEHLRQQIANGAWHWADVLELVARIPNEDVPPPEKPTTGPIRFSPWLTVKRTRILRHEPVDEVLPTDDDKRRFEFGMRRAQGYHILSTFFQATEDNGTVTPP